MENPFKALAKKVAVKKAELKEVVEGVSTVCPNCEDSGMSCSVCKQGRDDDATFVV